MGHHPAADVHTFANVQRQAAVTPKDIDPWRMGQMRRQVLLVSIHKALIRTFLNLTTPFSYCKAMGPAALKRVSPAIVSLIVFFEVPVSAVLAAWWLDQTPPLGIIPGIALILFGCVLVVTRTRGGSND